MFARLVWFKREDNSICWVPPWRIITSASGFHKWAPEKKWNGCKVTLKQKKGVEKDMISLGLQNQGTIVEIRNEQRMVTDYALIFFNERET